MRTITTPVPGRGRTRDQGRSRSRIPLAPLLVGLALLLPVSLGCGVGMGAAGIGTADVLRFLWAGATGGTVHASDAAAYTIVWEIRLPRVVLGAVIGAGLAAVGVAVQAMVRNALADPFVLGISSGAAVGANAVILFGAFAGLGVGRCRCRRSPPPSRPWSSCTRWHDRPTASPRSG